MSEILSRIRILVNRGEVRISEHGYDELAADQLFARDLLKGLRTAVIIEDYPEYPKGPCVLVLQMDSKKHPVHVVWGIPKGENGPAVLVTAYRPDSETWAKDFMRRKHD